jgi:hypothetical protein
MDGTDIATLPRPHAGEYEIPVSEAVRLADAFVLTYLGDPANVQVGQERLEASVIAIHGKPIAFDSIMATDGILYVPSAFAAFPDSMPGSLKRWLGPWFIVPYAERGQIVLTVAVSALNTHVGVHDSGRLRLPAQHGNEFRVAGVPAEGEWTIPLTSESASLAVSRAFNVRPTGTPTPLRVLEPEYPQMVRWRVSLGSEVRVRTLEGDSTTTKELFVVAWVPPDGTQAQPMFFVRGGAHTGQQRVVYPSTDGIQYQLLTKVGHPTFLRRVVPLDR